MPFLWTPADASRIPQLVKAWRRISFILIACVGLAVTSGCAVTPRYNSLDLALLPCEAGDSPEFFRAIEFDEHGSPVHDKQLQNLSDRFNNVPPVTDLVLFVHGWNKNPSSAELDYQNFICRLHGRLRNIVGDRKRAGGLLVIGVFWPSTITNRAEEPLLLKPLSYYRIRDRADRVAEIGLTELLSKLRQGRLSRDSSMRVHLIGHSFGGRMVIRALETLQRRNELVPFLMDAESVNVVLVNAAVSPSRFEWISEAVSIARRNKMPARFTQDTSSYLFNVHSRSDSANRYLFPLASLFNDDQTSCAAGACGVPTFPTLCVDASGAVASGLSGSTSAAVSNEGLNTWNVNATSIVFDHSDIYKGRVSTLIADLLYDPEIRRPARTQIPNANTALRCPG